MQEVNMLGKLTRSIRDSETSIDFVQGPPGSRRERVKCFCNMELVNHEYHILLSVESQKGINAVQRCSTENQKGAIAVQGL